MNENMFELLFSLLERQLDSDILLRECYQNIKSGKVLVHDLGIFKKGNISEIIADKISMQILGIQNSNLIGIDTLYKKLDYYSEDTVRQFTITTIEKAYQIICSANMGQIIGTFINNKINFDNDILYQEELKKRGHLNKSIYVFDKGELQKKYS